MSQEKINPELAAIESALAALKPAAAGVDRDRVMFLAGRMSAVTNAPPHQKQKTSWLWPCATAVSMLLAVTSCGMLFLRGAATDEKVAGNAKSNITQTVENIPRPLWYEHTRKEPSEVQRPRPSSGRDNMQTDYLSLSMLVAEKGVEALPGPSWIPIGPENVPRRNLEMRDDVNMF